MICGTKDGAVVFYDIKKGECENIVSEEHKSQVVGCDWQPSKDGKCKVATVDDLGGLLIWGA